ncbi:MAG TPA: geranylgeranylglycerol-phosphate geranylgeranyltransferase [Flavobacteriaceae bacterium]|nr:geranylgeranylglycerol-phosphate geranylgeranyltransferase [Flavobacteriaceae bacterium]
MKPFLRLIRLPNLALIIYLQLVIRFALFPIFNFTPTLSLIQFIIFTLSIVFISAAGYVINDICDYKIDKINKPNKQIVGKSITIENTKQYYKILNVLGLLLAAIVVLQTQKPTLFLIYISIVYLLFWYSKMLKGLFFIGNFIVALLIAIIIPFQLFFEDSLINYEIKLAIGFLTFFAFLLNLIRELIKDIEDINGDKKLNLKTIPIVLGRSRARKISAVLVLPALFLCFYLLANYYTISVIISIYILLFIILPLLFIYYKLTVLKSYNSIKTVSLLLKLTMLFGINTLLIAYLIF